MNQERAPLFEKVVSHKNRHTSSFHVPGHKSGQGLYSGASSLLSGVMSIDLTEITGLDDLHHPEGAIREAEQLAAACFGAEQTYFLVGGSTVGNLAMILTVCNRGDLIVVQRNAHKSVVHGLMLAGVSAVFVDPCWDRDLGITVGVDPDDVKAALERYPDAKAVLVTNPNYYGYGTDLEAIASLAHAKQISLLVDEAHGAHYGFHPAFPASALSCGADAVVQSTHKMLTSMTMGAMLHVQGDRIDRQTLKQRLGMVQSSSPSYPILVSLDLCRRTIAVQRNQAFEQGLQAVAKFRSEMMECPRFRIVDDGNTGHSFMTKDPYKIVVYDQAGILDGFSLQRELELRDCMIEMADIEHILCVFSLASTVEDALRLSAAFRDISLQKSTGKQELSRISPNIYNIEKRNRISEPVVFGLNQGKAHGHTYSRAQWSQAVGHISAEMVIPYPPGVPLLFPGETITREIAQYAQQLARLGARFQGLSDLQRETVMIYQ